MSKKVKVTLCKSKIGRNPKHILTLKGLGLGRVNSSSILEDTPSVRGMINQVSYMVKTEEQ